MTSRKRDATFTAARKKIDAAIEQIDVKAQGAVADLCRLTDALVAIRETELKGDEGTYGSGLPTEGEDGEQ